MPDPSVVGLPTNVDAERFLLAASLTNPENVDQIRATVAAQDFSLEKHRRIFARIIDLADRGEHIDTVTIGNELNRAGQLESIGGLSYLTSLDDGLPAIFAVDSYVRIVKDKALLRRTIAECQALIDQCLLHGDSAHVLGRAEQVIRQLNAETVADCSAVTGRDIIARHGGVDSFVAVMRNPGIRTPWPQLNRFLSGWRPQEMTIIAARPSVGKTAVALQIAEAAARNGVNVPFFSLEMPSESLLNRLVCARARVDSDALRHNRLTKEQQRQYHLAIGEIGDLPIHFSDKAVRTVPAICAAIRKLNASHPIGLVVIDYLQLLDASGRYGNRTEAISAISRGLKLAAMEFDIPFIVLSQLSRGPEKENREPVLSDLREGGSLEQDSDNVIFLHRKDPNDFGSIRSVTLTVAKQRNGGVIRIDMVFQSEVCRLMEEESNCTNYEVG